MSVVSTHLMTRLMIRRLVDPDFVYATATTLQDIMIDLVVAVLSLLCYW